eukprot:gnl/Dysnectes_brevis/2168_a2524_1006.p1 GENE.gnl/Dysnectes_brevis/2168_a2524_1006~~gnl/Dysnectes_brevis/2168_a2524_1006.p1  ORF type:complete len:592 (+),score=175.73 gnl/Dysnectes_brevis/2168_a2524_1006:53-1828(+)
MDPETPSYNSFQEDLSTGFDLVAHRLWTGKKNALWYVETLQQLSKIQSKHVSGMVSLVTSLRRPPFSSMAFLQHIEIAKIMEDYLEAEKQFYSTLERDIVRPLDSSRTKYSKMAARITNDVKQAKATAQRALSSEERSKIRSRNAFAEAEKADQDFLSISSSAAANPKLIAKAKHKAVTTAKAAEAADRDYRAEVAAATERVAERDAATHQGLGEMEEIDTARMKLVVEITTRLAGAFQQLGQEIRQSATPLLTAALQMNVREDMTAFVNQHRSDAHPPPAPQYVRQTQWIPSGSAAPAPAAVAQTTPVPSSSSGQGSKDAYGTMAFRGKSSTEAIDDPSSFGVRSATSRPRPNIKNKKRPRLVSSPSGKLQIDSIPMDADAADGAPEMSPKTVALPTPSGPGPEAQEPAEEEELHAAVSAVQHPVAAEEEEEVIQLPEPDDDSVDAEEGVAPVIGGAVGLFAFENPQDDELSLAEGEHVDVLSMPDGSEGAVWWICRKADGREGSLPSNYLRMDGADGDGGAEEAPAAAEITEGCKVVAAYAFDASNERELSVCEHDCLEVMQVKGGWLYVKRVDDDAEGYVPKSYCDIM